MADTVDLYAGLVAACGQRYTAAGGRRYSPVMGLALWALVRHLDRQGAGRVHLAALKAAGLGLWKRDSYYRALRDAESLGLVHVTIRKRDGVEVIEARGIARVAERLELPNVGARKVSVPLDSLRTAKSFRRALWSAYHAGRTHNTGAPITRSKLRQLSGMAESTQRAYDRDTVNETGYRVTGATPNAVILATDGTPDALQAARDLVHGGCYIDRHSRALVRPIGNTYSSSLAAGSQSRARKINRLLRLGLVSTAAGQPKRLFFVMRAGEAPADAARRAGKAARDGRAEDVPLAPTGQRAGAAVLWTPVWDSWSLTHVAGV